MKKLLLTEDIGGRIRRWWRHIGDDGKQRITTETVQEVDKLLDRNRALYNNAPARSGDLKYVAEIPATIIEEECRKICVETGEKMSVVYPEIMSGRSTRAQSLWRRLLNDRDLRYFRTSPGRVGVR